MSVIPLSEKPRDFDISLVTCAAEAEAAEGWLQTLVDSMKDQLYRLRDRPKEDPQIAKLHSAMTKTAASLARVRVLKGEFQSVRSNLFEEVVRDLFDTRDINEIEDEIRVRSARKKSA